MGVSDFYKVLRDVCPEVIVRSPLSELCGYRIAVDISIFLYKFIRTSGKERWVDSFIILMCSLKKYGIKAVCIFDGPKPPTEKKMEQERRRRDSEKMVSKLREMKRLHGIVKTLIAEEKEFDSANQWLADDIRCLLGTKKDKKGGPTSTINYADIYDVEEGLRLAIFRYERQTIPITPEYAQKAKEIIRCMGLAQLQAEGEAETLCAYLAVKGEVDAVLSEDTDVLAYGTPLLLSKIDLEEQSVTTLFHKNIQNGLGMNVNEVRDLCILLSCDYNDRVTGYPPIECKLHGKHVKYKKPVGIGAKAAVCMMDVYRNLEKVEDHVVDMTPLNYRRCRELFTIPVNIPHAIVPYSDPVMQKEMEEFLKAHNCRVSMKYIMEAWRPPPLIFGTVDAQYEKYVSDTERLNKLLSAVEGL
jgi:5'-3' exonuclease